jgi:hypothetical protein
VPDVAKVATKSAKILGWPISRRMPTEVHTLNSAFKILMFQANQSPSNFFVPKKFANPDVGN